MLTRGMKSVEKVLKELSENPNSDRVVDYHFSKLTDLLQEELGGNCRTVACLCLREHTPSEVLERNLALSDRLTRTRNFPVINDELTLALHAQYRARIISLKKLLGMDIGRSNPAMVPTNIDGLRRELNKVQAENVSPPTLTTESNRILRNKALLLKMAAAESRNSSNHVFLGNRATLLNFARIR